MPPAPSRRAGARFLLRGLPVSHDFDAREHPAKGIVEWEHERDEKQAGVGWHFATADARIKLTQRYTTRQPGRNTGCEP